MNSFGNIFKIEIFGESHGEVIGIVIDGLPAGIPLSPDEFKKDIARRQGGSTGTTSRVEEDIPEILSGVFNGFTTGAPLTIIVRNRDIDSSLYHTKRETPRPGHTDYTANVKYGGFQDYRGGGHSSGRMTVALIMAGVVAKKIISPITIDSQIISIGGVNPWHDKLANAIKEGDSLGGIIECTIAKVPAGLGDPFFDSVESVISHIVFSIPGVRGVEFGDGFRASGMRGSEHNDPIVSQNGTTSKNGSGGINGGISNGNDIVFRVAVKPTSTISAKQRSFNFQTGKVEDFKIEGRHDTCFALRTPVIIEAAAAIAIANFRKPERAPEKNR